MMSPGQPFPGSSDPDPGSGPSISDPSPASSGSGPRPSISTGHHQLQQQRKRTRALLSCGPCRASKLKCDRAEPCGQCFRKARVRACVYAPRKEKPIPAKGLAARLRRLEGMVRGMMDGDGGPVGGGGDVDRPSVEGGGGRAQVVVGGGGGMSGKTSTYVGATHFMAMLDDIGALQGYFDEDDPEDGGPYVDPESQTAEMFMLPTSAPRSQQELLSYLPPKHIVDRLTMRYFNAYSPSQHTIHRPVFMRQYKEFWDNPSSFPLDWIALLFMVSSLGTMFSTFMAPHEVEGDSKSSPMERFELYRRVAGWALVSAKYSSSGLMTLQPIILYSEAEFFMNSAAHMNSYLLSAVKIRLMMKMGLHRDPSRLPGISPFEGEMRRRMWNLAVQMDLIISFHMGLPSMIHGIESDTGPPRNLTEEDLDEECSELPPSRPDSEYTQLTYPIWKGAIARIFGLVARQANALSLPAYSEVMKLDDMIEEKWKQVPHFMKMKPLEDSITDPPHKVNQCFGLASLYQKTRCVLHRRYLIDPTPKKEHEYSRRACLDAGLKLLEHQDTIYRATLPAGVLRQNGWFITTLAVYDFLLAAMMVYLVIQNETYPDWSNHDASIPTKEELHDKLRKSHSIWLIIVDESPVAKKAAGILGTMLEKIDLVCEQRKMGGRDGRGGAVSSPGNGQAISWLDSSLGGVGPMSNLSITEPPRYQESPSSQLDSEPQVQLSHSGLMLNYQPVQDVDAPWLPLDSVEMDWATFDEAIRSDSNAELPAVEDWMQQRSPLGGDLDELMAADIWGGQESLFQYDSANR